MTYAAFLEFSKTYDRVSNLGLLATLLGYGFVSSLLRLPEAVYRYPRALVWIGSEKSESLIHEIGVRQGCLAPPIFSNMCINTLLDGLGDISR